MLATRKNSRKRQAMLELLQHTKEHPTAEMLYNALKPEYPELSLGTVYRNLSVLVDDGMLVRVGNVAGQERYDARLDAHAHFICKSCGRVIDLEIPDISSSIYDDIRYGFGFVPEAHSLTVSGQCDKCC